MDLADNIYALLKFNAGAPELLMKQEFAKINLFVAIFSLRGNWKQFSNLHDLPLAINNVIIFIQSIGILAIQQDFREAVEQS